MSLSCFKNAPEEFLQTRSKNLSQVKALYRGGRLIDVEASHLNSNRSRIDKGTVKNISRTCQIRFFNHLITFQPLMLSELSLAQTVFKSLFSLLLSASRSRTLISRAPIIFCISLPMQSLNQSFRSQSYGLMDDFPRSLALFLFQSFQQQAMPAHRTLPPTGTP